MTKSLYQFTFLKQLLIIIAIFLFMAPAYAQAVNVNLNQFLKTNRSAPRIILNKRIKLNARETAEIPVNLAKEFKAGITFFAAPSVSVSLIDSSGKVQQSIKDDSPEAMEMVKTFHLTGDFAGVWMLRFENQSDEQHTAAVSVWTDRNLDPLSILEPINK